MKQFIILSSLISLVVLSGVSNAADHRNFCKTYYSRTNLSDCIYKQEAASKRLRSGIYYDYVVQSCKQDAKRVDRKAVYTNYVVADKCAQKEQRRIVEEEQLRAEAAKDRAAADYFEEAAKTERQYRKKYYKK